MNVLNTTQFISISSEYKYDTKLSLQPRTQTFIGGHTFTEHPIYTNIKDVAFAKDTFFALTTAFDFSTIINDTVHVDGKSLVLFTAFQAQNGNYVSNVNNTLYASSTSLGSDEFFRIVQNNDNTFSIAQDDLYATVKIQPRSWDIYFTDKIDNDVNGLQKFDIVLVDNTITITTKFTVPEWVSAGLTSSIKRFWSYSIPNNNIVRAIGMVNDPHYTPNHKHVFITTVYAGLFDLGFDGKIKWVDYFNDFDDTRYNKTVDIKNSVDVKQNMLINCPYKTQIDADNKTMKINMVSLKNIQTPEYEYDIK